MMPFMRAAIFPNAGDDAALEVACVPTHISEKFVTGVERSIEHMLLKPPHSMQDGLRELAITTDDVIVAMDRLHLGCVGTDAGKILEGAQKLRSLTEKTK